jgi:type II secretory ATPase GspE/PulE/Tfp pilus assembly ATPase PilB-like protein
MAEEIIKQPEIPKIVTQIITEALETKASDIHLEPKEKDYVLRFRIDGIINNINHLSKSHGQMIISRFKVLSNLDLAQKRLPQDGKTIVKINGHELDCRIATLPTGKGEKITVRLLNRSNLLLSLNELGINNTLLEKINNIIHQPSGMILITGPTGSGKTTTLYSILSSLAGPTKNIMTIEDPIEYELEQINQMQINPKIGLTFAAGLRALLRHDPDIIMIGEIRDSETAQIAVRAALTGHLILSSLHTNDSVSAIERLIDLGAEPYLVASTLRAVIAQRLVRLICTFCHGKGCLKCRAGFNGRIGIFELFANNEEIKEMIHQRKSSSSIRNLAVKQGMKTLKESAEELVRMNKTKDEEIKEEI